MGKYTDNVTLLGTTGEIGIGFLGLDAPADFRDLCHDFEYWEYSWSHAGETTLDVIGFLPVVGIIKYSDEVGVLIKNGDKYEVKKIIDIEKGAGKIFDINKIRHLLKTEANTSFFWSGKYTNSAGEVVGVMDDAARIAKSRGGTTLETLIESKGIKLPEWNINDPASIKAWEDVSAEYAKQVSGEVRVVIGNQLREGNIWESVELPRLKANSNVTKIISIDPATLKETIIFKR